MITPCCEHCTHPGPPQHTSPCRLCFGLTPATFRLYDALNCCAAAVDEAESGRHARAIAAWASAYGASRAASGSGHPAAAALAVLVEASRPSYTACRPELWQALDAASLAVLYAMSGPSVPADQALEHASRLAAQVPGYAETEAFAVVLDAARAMADAAVTA